MATLTRIEDVITNTAIYTFDKRPKATRTDNSFKRRSGSYTVLGMDYGVQPFGNYAAPTDIRPFPYQFRLVVPATGNVEQALDLAAADFTRAVGRGRMHRLVRTFAGKENVNIAQCIDCQDVTTSSDNWRHRDFIVTWELTKPWQDRVSRGPHIIGDGSAPILGTTSLLMGFGNFAVTTTTANVYNIVADGSDGLAKPTVDDEGPVIKVIGPFGGDQGFIIANSASLLKDGNGNAAQEFIEYKQALASGQTLVLDCGARTAYIGSTDVSDNIFIPDYQPHWQIVVAGVINPFSVVCFGTPASFVVNASVTKFSIAWYGQYW